MSDTTKSDTPETKFAEAFLQALEWQIYRNDKNTAALNRKGLSYLVNNYLNEFEAELKAELGRGGE